MIGWCYSEQMYGTLRARVCWEHLDFQRKVTLRTHFELRVESTQQLLWSFYLQFHKIAENFNTLLHERSPFACLIYAFSGAWYGIYWKAVSHKFRTFKHQIFCKSRLIWQLCVRLLRHSECGGGSHIWKWRAGLNLLAWTYYGNGRGQDYNILDEIKNCSSSSSEKQPQFSSTIANHL